MTEFRTKGKGKERQVYPVGEGEKIYKKDDYVKDVSSPTGRRKKSLSEQIFDIERKYEEDGHKVGLQKRNFKGKEFTLSAVGLSQHEAELVAEEYRSMGYNARIKDIYGLNEVWINGKESKEPSKEKLNELINDEKKGANEYKELGYDKLAEDEEKHKKFLEEQKAEEAERLKRLEFIKENSPEKFEKAVEEGKIVPTADEMNKLYGENKPIAEHKIPVEVRGSNPQGTQLAGHTNPENAYVVHNYPYGRYRTDMRYWIESTSRGDRLCTQSLNPKTGNWNNPHKSTYSDIMVLKKDPVTGHVVTDSIGSWEGEERINDFTSKYELSDKQKKTAKILVARDRGSKHYTWKISPGEPTQTKEEQLDIINKATAYEYAKMKKEEK